MSAPLHDSSNIVSTLRGSAWSAWNASYHESGADAYRALANALYQQAWHELITARFAQLDEQNALLDSFLESAS